VDIEGLCDHIHRLVRLRFVGGEEVEAILIGVDREAHSDVMYEVRRILHAGSPPGTGTVVGAVLVAGLCDLVEWQPLGPAGPDEGAGRPPA